MNNHKINNTILIWLLYFAVLLNYGCSTLATIPDKSFQSSSYDSIVFGHLEIIFDGQIIPIKTALININPQSESTRTLPKYLTELRSDGYFIIALPADKYTIPSIGRKGPFGKMCEGYMICDYFCLMEGKPATIDFETVSGRATYVGSIKFIVSTKTNYFHLYQAPENPGKLVEKGLRYGLIGLALIPNANPTEKIYATKEECERKNLNCQKETEIASEDWKIEGDFEKARKTFASLYPNHPEPIENLAEICSGKKCLEKQSIFIRIGETFFKPKKR